MDDLESYEPQTSEVLTVEPGWVTVYLEERSPESGEAVAIQSDDGDGTYVVARERLGGRQIRAMLLGDDDWLESGLEARATGRAAGFCPADDGSVDTRTTSIVPESGDIDRDWIPIDWDAPNFAELRGSFPPVATGYEGVDLVAPVAEGGTNLVIDTSQRETPGRNFEAAVVDALTPIDLVRAPVFDDDEVPDRVSHAIRSGSRAPERMAALRLAVALAAHRRDDGTDLVVSIDLPPVGRTPASDERQATEPGYGELIDLLGAGLASTEEASITALLRLPIPDAESGISPIVETLDLGDVDAQIFVDDSGRFAPDRSTSDAHRSADDLQRVSEALEALRRAREAREKRDLFGERELSEAEREALEDAEALHTDLTSSPTDD